MSDSADTFAGQSAWPSRIFAITLFTEDLEQAKEFYQNVFGLPIDYEDANSAVFKFGDTLVNLLKVSEAKALIEPAKVANRESGARYVFTIRVEDVDALCAELVSRGLLEVREGSALGGGGRGRGGKRGQGAQRGGRGA